MSNLPPLGSTGLGMSAEQMCRLADAATERIIARIEGLRGAYLLRLCTMSHQTRWDDVRETLDRIAVNDQPLACDFA